MKRRQFLSHSAKSLLLLANPALAMSQVSEQAMRGANSIRLFLSGDVMTGRGIDQVLPFPSDPKIYEPYVRDAGEYVALAERANGPTPRAVEFAYIWGDALAALERMAPDVRLINLESESLLRRQLEN